MVWLHYLPHWRETQGRWRKAGMLLHRACHSQRVSESCERGYRDLRPGLRGRRALFEERRFDGPRRAGTLVGSLVWGIGLSLGGTTGYAINPARDFGPRVAHAILPVAGKGGSDWGYAATPLVGPLVGGALAGWLLLLLGVA